jgi:hypothetical protein
MTISSFVISEYEKKTKKKKRRLDADEKEEKEKSFLRSIATHRAFVEFIDLNIFLRCLVLNARLLLF